MPSANRDEIATSLKQRTYFGNPDEVASEVSDRLKLAWLNSGFLKAEVHSDGHMLTRSPANARVAVTVRVDEGPQYRLKGIGFRNNRAISNVEFLRKLFPINGGDVFDRAAIAKGLENLRLAYGEFGYINFTSVPDSQFDEERHNIFLDIDVDEGEQFYINRIDIVGLDESVFENVKKDLLVKPGDVYNQRLVALFLKNYFCLLPSDASIEPRFNLKLSEKAGTVAITYDFRRCQAD